MRGTGKEFEIKDVMYRPHAKGRVGKSGCRRWRGEKNNKERDADATMRTVEGVSDGLVPPTSRAPFAWPPTRVGRPRTASMQIAKQRARAKQSGIRWKGDCRMMMR